MNRDDVIVFVTELARRQYVRRRVLDHGFVDASRLLTFTRLRDACAQAARQSGLLHARELSDVARAILLRRSADAARESFAASGSLNVLSRSALADTLEALVDTLSPFGRDAQPIHDWMLEQKPESGKLHQLGLLYRTYREHCARAQVADTRDTNAAVLALLAGPTARWPHVLSSLTGRLVFRSIRWLNPFEEPFVGALKKRLGDDRVPLYSALPPAHAEKIEDRLAARIRTEVMMGADEAWTGWAEDLTDALEVEDPHLAISSRERLSFSHSVGLYGEVEDVARRIAWEIEHHRTPPEQIALVVRNLGDYSDAIMNVFERFHIPCFFRRGLPASSLPLVKTFLSLLALPLTNDRNRFCALLQSPALRWAGLDHDEERRQLAFDILASGVGPRLQADSLRRCLENHYRNAQPPPPADPVRARLNALAQNLARLRTLAAPAPLHQHARNALDLIRDFGLEQAAEGSAVPAAIRLADRRALETTRTVIAGIEDATRADAETAELADFVDILEESLENATVSPGRTEESGVWVLNPFDAAGLRFAVVVVAGLNEGVFPAVPRQDSLFNDAERGAIRDAMKQRGLDLPQWGLPLSTVRSVQESALFLISVGAARERLVLSYRACDTDGREMVPSDFFRSLWHLAGWPAMEKIAAGDYDIWRAGHAGADSHFHRHLKKQQGTPPYQRTPMPGESYLATIPLPLCRAADEARQRVACAEEGQAGMPDLQTSKSAIPGRLAHAVSETISIERSRERFFSRPEAGRPAAEPYCGKLGSEPARQMANAWLSHHTEFSPTGLESLARCRYRFLLSQVAHLGALRTQEDAPDVMDRGRLIHQILEHTYRALAGDTSGLDPALAKEFARLCRPRAWAVETAPGRWRLATGTKPDGKRVLPLATFDPADAGPCVKFAQAVADALFARAEQSGGLLRLGDPGIWATEKPKIRRIVANYVELDAESAAAARRFPALFELTFGRQFDGTEPDMPALLLTPASGSVSVHGQVDRVDMVFDAHGDLAGLLVVDYKTPSRGGLSEDRYAEEIAENLDCQLPVYGFAAQQFFFGRHNEPDVNELTHAVYHIQDRDRTEMSRQFEKRRVQLSHASEESGPLAGRFLDRLVENLARIEAADFSVDPLDCTYCDFEHICRVDVNALAGAGEGGTE